MHVSHRRQRFRFETGIAEASGERDRFVRALQRGAEVTLPSAAVGQIREQQTLAANPAGGAVESEALLQHAGSLGGFPERPQADPEVPERARLRIVVMELPPRR